MAAVLVIEDEANIRLFISVNLKARGYSVVEAATGTEGLRLMRDHLPAALILDMLLPDMDGWDILHAMSEDEALRLIPVILMTGSVHSQDSHEGEYPNLTYRLIKPSSVETLIEAVQNAVKMRKV